MFTMVAAVSLAPALSMGNTGGVLLRHFQDPGKPDRIVVGTATGDVLGFNAKTGTHDWTLPGGGSPVRDACRVQGRLFWCERGSNEVRCVTPSFEPVTVPLAESGLPGDVTALDEWRGRLVAQTDQGLRVIDPKTLKVLDASQCFPKDVAPALAEGPCKFLWRGDRGLIVSFRHYGQYEKAPEDGGVRDISLIDAWSCDKAGRHRFLGGYTAAVTDYRSTEGSRVFVQQGDKTIDLPHGHSDLENVTVGPEGVVAVLKTKALTIPFAKSGWLAGEQRPFRVQPEYSTQVGLAGSNLWFSAGDRWAVGSLEDGDCTIMVPRRAAIRQVVADESGAYVLTDKGVSRVDPDDDASLRNIGVVAYELGSPDRLSIEQRKLRDALRRNPSVGGIGSLLKTAKLTKAIQRLPKAPPVAALQYGDVVMDGNSTKLYVGDGKVASFSNGFDVEPLRIGALTRFGRILSSDPAESARPVPYGSGLLDYISPVGINRPLYPGGPVASVVLGASFDRPYLPGHFTLSNLIPGWVGTPYVWGGTQKGEGCDCSGFVQGVYREMGISLPRVSQDIGRARRGMIVTGDLHYGDVLVFPSPRHVAIYIGNGHTAEAVRGGVGYSSIYRRRLAVVRRFIL
ncbi:hypothetical protein BH11ARM2_BH11ARM2_28590 [soil metagenome]